MLYWNYYYGITQNVTTLINGKWNLTYTPDVNGTFTTAIGWDGNNSFDGFKNITRFNVNKTNIILLSMLQI